MTDGIETELDSIFTCSCVLEVDNDPTGFRECGKPGDVVEVDGDTEKAVKCNLARFRPVSERKTHWLGSKIQTGKEPAESAHTAAWKSGSGVGRQG